jgi:hypothetical protein
MCLRLSFFRLTWKMPLSFEVSEERDEILPQYCRPLTAEPYGGRRRVRKDEHGLDRHLRLRALHAILFHAFRSNIIKDSLNIYFLVLLPLFFIQLKN